jgi:hypothetical protein
MSIEALPLTRLSGNEPFTSMSVEGGSYVEGGWTAALPRMTVLDFWQWSPDDRSSADLLSNTMRDISSCHPECSEGSLVATARKHQADILPLLFKEGVGGWFFLKHQDQSTLDILNVDQWEFYVVPTEKLKGMRSIKLEKLQQIAEAVTFAGLSAAVTSPQKVVYLLSS